jgi:hypothetical protein
VIAILIALVGNAVFSIIFQIKNNEQQDAAIHANATEIHSFENNVINLQTPLSAMVVRLETRLISLEARLNTSEARVETIDKNGTRAMESVLSTQQRMLQASDRFADRLLLVDQRLNELQLRMKDHK